MLAVALARTRLTAEGQLEAADALQVPVDVVLARPPARQRVGQARVLQLRRVGQPCRERGCLPGFAHTNTHLRSYWSPCRSPRFSRSLATALASRPGGSAAGPCSRAPVPGCGGWKASMH